MPRAGDAFLLGALPLTHDPLARIDTQANKPPFDLEAILQQVELFVTDFLFPAIKSITGIDLSFLGNIFDGIDLSQPGGIVAAIVGAVENLGGALIQQVIDAIVNGLTGSSTTGNNPGAIVLSLINQGLSIPITLFNDIFAALAALTGQVTAVQNNPGGASQTDDFSSVGVTAYTNVQGILAVASGVIQTAALSAGYIGTPVTPRKPMTDKHGLQILVDAKLRGITRGWICGDATMSNYAAVEIYSGFDGDAVRIVTGASPTLVAPQKQIDLIGTDRIQATAFDIRYDPGANKFIVLRNTQSVLEWVDSTNLVTHGSGKRLVGPVSNGLNESDNRGFGIKKATFYDW